ncbi:MAG TPA: spermidine synthase [Lachnospiraceae bacterium]|nr:spermidine synthase [Lachnospiraceae bacterium]
MEMWFSEYHTPNVKLTIRTDSQLYTGQSDYQRFDVVRTQEFGKMLISDGEIVFSEADEFIYDEMVTHVPMAVHPHVRKVLIFGGGDGGVATCFTKYPEIEEITLVEPDEQMVEVCRKYFPEQTVGLDDPRVHIYYQDGLRFLRSVQNEYDIIVNDSTDPFGHEEGLFTTEFYGMCYKALKDDGIIVYQHGSPFYDLEEEACRAMHRKVYKIFPVSRVYQAHITTCSAGYWLFGFASKKYHPLADFDPERWKKRNIETGYYTTHLHIGAFMLPKYVEDLLEEEENRMRSERRV